MGLTNNKPNDVRVVPVELLEGIERSLRVPDGCPPEIWKEVERTVNGYRAELRAILAQPADQQGETPRATEKDIERWHALIAESPEGPWVMGNGGSFDRQVVKPISDELMSELGQWLRMGYTPWNGRSVSPTDRQFMYLLYYSVQGLVSRVRSAERDLHSAQPATAKVALPERETLKDVMAAVLGGDAYDCTRVWSAWGVGTMTDDDFVPIVEQEERLYELVDACIDEFAKLNGGQS